MIDNIRKRMTDQKKDIAEQQTDTTEAQETLENSAEHSRKADIQNLISSLNTLLPADNSKPYKALLDRLQTIDPNNP